MILPGKHLRPDRSLLGIGAEILGILEHEQTVSELWQRIQDRRDGVKSPLSFDWFVLSLAFLYAIGAVHFDRGILTRASSQ